MTENDNSTKTDMSKIELISSNTPTSSTDLIRVARKEDGSLFLQLISDLPDGFIENHRTILAKKFVRNFIDSLCYLVDYYPTKPKNK